MISRWPIKKEAERSGELKGIRQESKVEREPRRRHPSKAASTRPPQLPTKHRDRIAGGAPDRHDRSAGSLSPSSARKHSQKVEARARKLHRIKVSELRAEQVRGWPWEAQQRRGTPSSSPEIPLKPLGRQGTEANQRPNKARPTRLEQIKAGQPRRKTSRGRPDSAASKQGGQLGLVAQLARNHRGEGGGR